MAGIGATSDARRGFAAGRARLRFGATAAGGVALAFFRALARLARAASRFRCSAALLTQAFKSCFARRERFAAFRAAFLASLKALRASFRRRLAARAFAFWASAAFSSKSALAVAARSWAPSLEAADFEAAVFIMGDSLINRQPGNSVRQNSDCRAATRFPAF